MKMSVKCGIKLSQRYKWTAKTRAPKKKIANLNYFIVLMTIYKRSYLLRDKIIVFLWKNDVLLPTSCMYSFNIYSDF